MAWAVNVHHNPIFIFLPISLTLSSSSADLISATLPSALMDTLLSPSSVAFASAFPIFSPKRARFVRPLPSPLASKGKENEADPLFDSKDVNRLPVLSSRHHYLLPLSKDAAMGMVLSAATGRGWTTGSGMEGPSVPAGIEAKSGIENISTLPWSLFTKSPRRRMRVAFTCNICGQRTTRAINPHAYTDGTVFVQCCGCNAYHKLVDNLNLFHEMKCYVDPSFNYRSNGWQNVDIKYLDDEDVGDDIFPV